MMEHADPRDEILAEAKAMHNDICIVADMELARLVGFHEDALDCYWHVRYRGGNEAYCSACGPCVSLRGVRRYEIMDNLFAMNGAPKSDEFLMSEGDKEADARLYGQRVADWKHGA